MNPSAIITMRRELNRISSAMAECITDEGHVRSSHRYRYQELVNLVNRKTGSHISSSQLLRWLEAQRAPVSQ